MSDCADRDCSPCVSPCASSCPEFIRDAAVGECEALSVGSLEREIEFRTRLTLAEARRVLVRVFSSRRSVCVDNYRWTRHSVLTRRTGSTRHFDRFDVASLLDTDEYLSLLDRGYSRLDVFDQFKLSLCAHNVYRYDSDVSRLSNARWPRVYSCTRSVEFDVLGAFSERVALEQERDVSDNNLGLFVVQRFRFVAEEYDDVRCAVYVFMNEYSELRYELSLELEFDYPVDSLFSSISRFFADLVEPLLDSVPRFVMDPLVVATVERTFVRVSSAGMSVSRPFDVLFYKAKYNGVCVYGVFDGADRMMLTDGSSFRVTDPLLFSTDFIYQFERLGDKRFVLTEVLAVRNYYRVCQDPLAYGFFPTVNRPSFQPEQEYPVGLVGLYLPEPVVRSVEAHVSSRSCNSAPESDHEFVRLSVEQSDAHITAMRSSVLDPERSVPLFSVSARTLSDLRPVDASLCDGALALCTVSSIERFRDRSCPVFSKWLVEREACYVKLKPRQTVELRFVNRRRADVDGDCHFASLHGPYIVVREDRPYRYDGVPVSIFDIDYSTLVGGLVYEFRCDSDTEFALICPRPDKRLPDSMSKVDRIVFDRRDDADDDGDEDASEIQAPTCDDTVLPPSSPISFTLDDDDGCTLLGRDDNEDAASLSLLDDNE